MDDVVDGGTVDGASREERRAACLAMVSLFVCSPIGSIVAYLWSQRNGSLFVRRYATTSLAIDVVLSTFGLIMIPLVLFAPQQVTFAVFLILWMVQMTLFIAAIVLAVRAWQGLDVADSVPTKALVDRLPTA